MHANHREDIDMVYSGDIAAAVGLKNTTTGDTLCDEKHPIILESMEFPEPVIRVAIEPKTKAGQEKMGIALAKLAEEDPTFKTYTDEETGQTIIAGMGELHLEIIVDRLLREFKVEANVGAPQVAYKETIRKSVRCGHASMPASPAVRASMVTSRSMSSPMSPARAMSSSTASSAAPFPRSIFPRSMPVSRARCRPAFWPAIPVVDVKVTLYDGSYHEVDSSEMAFKIAGSMAFKEACQKAHPAILEPIMKVAVIVPDDYMGDVIGDINARRGSISGMTPAMAPARSTPMCRCLRCLVMPPTCAARPRAAASTPWSPATTIELPKSKQRGDRRPSGHADKFILAISAKSVVG